MSGYMSIVERCLRVIINNPGGVTWLRLNERVDLLAKANKRQKTMVFQHLKGKNNIWNNGADDMTDTLFMSIAEAPADAVTETSQTPVSATASTKKTRGTKYGSAGATKASKAVAPPKPEPVEAKPEVAPVSEPVARPASKKPSIVFGDNALINEDDVMAEMAWHVYTSEDHGLTLSSLRKSVPEFSACADADRAYLVGQMRQRYGIGYYEKEVIGDRVIKVLAKRTGSNYPIERPDWFIKMGRQPFVNPDTNLITLRPQVATFGNVASNSLADQLAKLNAAELFANNAGKEPDEFDMDEDDSDMEMDGKLETAKPDTMEALLKSDDKPLATPTRDFVREWGNVRPQTEPAVATAPVAKPEPVLSTIAVAKPIDKGEKGRLEIPAKRAPEIEAVRESLVEKRGMGHANTAPSDTQSTVSKEDVTHAADTLRQIAAQLEAHASVSEALRKKKERFDVLMRMARESSVQIQTALDAHNELLDELQNAANDLTAL